MYHLCCFPDKNRIFFMPIAVLSGEYIPILSYLMAVQFTVCLSSCGLTGIRTCMYAYIYMLYMYKIYLHIPYTP